MNVYHLNCVEILAPTGDRAIGHCVLIQIDKRLILLDAGISSYDSENPTLNFNEAFIQQVGFNFAETRSAKAQIIELGFDPSQVSDIVLTHLDCDHSSGLLDFPQATVHVGAEELYHFSKEDPRYLSFVLQHQPAVQTYAPTTTSWLGFEARYLPLHLDLSIALIPLFGHTLGHCGIAFTVGEQVCFYIGDAYYLRIELTDPTHPIHELTTARAADNDQRFCNLERIKQLVSAHPEICVFGYHDVEEFEKI
ncbi:MBL fold metallo-hydrolase [Myroides odoratus]|uniref:MBL fold metallo-hydrolase n=1 Tax=Myroides odoratus TaxID=256 RepID=UPI0039B11328